MNGRNKTVGLALRPEDWDGAQSRLGEIEKWGYATLWLPGGLVPPDLGRIGEILRATRSLRVGTAVLPVGAFAWQDVARAHSTLAAEHPGRFVVGLGVHGPQPLDTLGEYLDRLDAADPPVPREDRILSALGPRMLELASARAAGAVPVLITPEHVAWARDRIGPDAWLVAQQFVVLDDRADRARDAARRVVAFHRDAEGGYGRHFRRMGFTDDDVDHLSDRLLDALVPRGGVEDVLGRVAEHHAAGADEVALTVFPGPDTTRTDAWRDLAQAVSRPAAPDGAGA